ncbi:MAG: DUF1501 domain-containing protein [Fimbriimonas sp.]
MSNHACSEYRELSRRGFLRGATALVGTALMPAWLPRVALAADERSERDVIVSIYLRGGADGLSLCVPHGEKAYYAARPTLAVPPPDSKRAKRALDLDGFFGFPVPFAPLVPIYKSGELLVVHATGAIANRWSRSHFDAQRWMEVGKPSDSTLASGWLARHLASTAPMVPNAALRGVSLMPGMAESLRQGPLSLPVPDPGRFAYDGGWREIADMEAVLKRSYERAPDLLRVAAEQTRATMGLLRRIDLPRYAPAGGAAYPDTDLGRSLRAAAALIRSEIGVEAIAVDHHGWDTHDDQGTLDGYLGQQLDELARALAAFHADLAGAGKRRYVLVAMSEFGRALAENESHGTEHGTGNAMLLMGPGIFGGRVLANWPGLHRDQLFERQDLRVTTDYRDVLAEVVQKRLGNGDIGAVFPGLTPKIHGVTR